MKNFFIHASILCMLFLSACNDGSIIGNDLLEGESIDIAYEDNFILSGQTLRGDSIATFRRNAVNQTYLLGRIEDPIFGTFQSDIYTALRFGTSVPTFEDDAVIDSVVLELEYDTLGFYGNINAVHDIEVYRVIEDWLDRDTIFSDQSFMTDMMPLGSKSLIANTTDSIRWQERDLEETSFIKLSPRISIPLDNAFGQEILDNTDLVDQDSSLIEFIKGLYIRSTPSESSMIGLNFSENRSAASIIGKLAVYYTTFDSDGEEEKKAYNFSLRTETASEFVVDYTGSDVEMTLNSLMAGEDFLYSQAFSGVNTEVTLPDLSSFEGTLINSAQLVLTVAEGEEFETDIYPPTQQFLMSEYNDEGTRILIDDLTKPNIDLNSGLGILDGSPKNVTLDNGDEVKTVTFNITDFVKGAIDEGDTSPRLVISPVGRSESPRRTIFYGTDHPTYPAKLRIAYTIVN